MPYLPDVARDILEYAWSNGLSMGPYLLLGLIAAAALQSFVPAERMHRFMSSYGVFGVIVASVAAVATPLCSCTTVSIMIPLLAAGVPWGPIFSWLIASPIISPTGFFLLGGTLGWHIAIAKVVAGLAMGIGGGMLLNHLQKQGMMNDQSRIPVASSVYSSADSDASFTESRAVSSVPEEAPCCANEFDPQGTRVQHGDNPPASASRQFAGSLWVSVRSLVPIFILFILVAGAIEAFVPTEWIMGLFGEDTSWGVPAAAILGVPLYTNTASAVPLVTSFVRLGMSSGAALAFILTGPGTSLPALGAVLVIARSKVLGLYLGILFCSSIILSYLFGLWF